MKEPKEYENNVHYWLRKIFYFVHFAKVEGAEVRSEELFRAKVLTKDEESELVKQQQQDPDKGETELALRTRLKEAEPEVITRKEAEEACLKLYAMFNMPLDEDVLAFMEDRRCAGGQPRCL